MLIDCRPDPCFSKMWLPHSSRFWQAGNPTLSLNNSFLRHVGKLGEAHMRRHPGTLALFFHE